VGAQTLGFDACIMRVLESGDGVDGRTGKVSGLVTSREFVFLRHFLQDFPIITALLIYASRGHLSKTI